MLSTGPLFYWSGRAITHRDGRRTPGTTNMLRGSQRAAHALATMAHALQQPHKDHELLLRPLAASNKWTDEKVK